MQPLLQYAVRMVGEIPVVQQAQSRWLSYALAHRVRHYSAGSSTGTVRTVGSFSQWVKDNGDQIRSWGSLCGIGSAVSGIVYAIATTASARNVKPIVDKMEADKSELSGKIEGLREKMEADKSELSGKIEGLREKMEADKNAMQAENNQRFDAVNRRLDGIQDILLRQAEERRQRAKEKMAVKVSASP